MNNLDTKIEKLENHLKAKEFSDGDFTLLDIAKLAWANQKELFQRVESLENRMTAVENRLDNVESVNTTQNNTLSNHEGRISAIERRING